MPEVGFVGRVKNIDPAEVVLFDVFFPFGGIGFGSYCEYLYTFGAFNFVVPIQKFRCDYLTMAATVVPEIKNGEICPDII